VSQFRDRPRQSLEDVGQAPGFGIGQRFGSYKEYAHAAKGIPYAIGRWRKRQAAQFLIAS